ncbi:AraC-like DNA-binding protein [Parabacteroides sp. PF5-5]|uniref:helix-turn-helix transcriptional regulator n=1 Tax=unclassified Parabacteroides TaxID=2649774 RepID=UPI002474F3C7|nr:MULTISPECIES: AraC family transcriptional regulator [unclassified Parabacteroides]MDH6306655.1 AraC-like DNA-binding protein [Parabacteroides sp. PH5-39]MDH6317622.1 AraC-like DNA-binding protein [Parabacteroides sp. PF5-13]MDH6321366.1 AraC-like DNA-binding protein [Parabacteroides sp. PH5-13]MDH6325069.1 AraC-like DNA-binding protein [Parabacteroides sp. PH5-8]MDH6328778.1 AraC-like DNA-binding protein [Parabacteroides sp. PH5-41]
MKDLHQNSKHLPFQDDIFDITAGFKHYEVVDNSFFDGKNKEFNHLIFILEGKLNVCYNEYLNNNINEMHFFLIPKSSEISIKALSPCKLIICSFNSLKIILTKVSQNYWNSDSKEEYIFRPLPIHYALRDFLHQMVRYIKNGMDSHLMDEIKFLELFLLLKKYYSKEEMSNLFHPILGKLPGFKDKILQNYKNANNVDELAKLVGMGRTNFDIKFKTEFGMPPLQWMLKQKAKFVCFSMSEPGNTLSDIMQKYNFNSPTHLNRFCKQQFGCTPSELMKRLGEKE